MESTEMMMASGGMIISIIMLLLPIVMLILIWRIMSTTSATSKKLDQLTLQVEELFQQRQSGAAATQDFAAAKSAAEKESDTFDLLASGSAAADDDTEESFELADAPDATATTDRSENQDEGFAYQASDEDIFGGFTSATEQETGALEPQEPDEGLAESSLDDSGEAFDSRFDSDTQAAGDTTEDAFREDFKLDAEEERLTDQIFGGGESREDFGRAFDTEEPAGESYDPFASHDKTAEEQEAAKEEPPAEEEAPAEEPPAPFEAEPVEEPPAIIKLADDPARPEVSMARCGACDHKLAYKKTLAGKKARCPSCKGAFILP